jgi:replicative DNA helicase
LKQYDPLAERALLASIIHAGDTDTDSGIADEVSVELAKNDLGSFERQKVYQSMLDLRNRSLTVDTVAITSIYVEDQMVMNELSQIMNTRTTKNIAPLIGKIKAFTAIRGLSSHIHNFSSVVEQNNIDVQEVVESFVADVNTVNLAQGVKQDYKAEHLASTFFHKLEERLKRKEEIIGLRSGIDTLDKATGGFRGGDLITIGALPSMGKTSLAISFIAQMIIDKLSPALFTYEMSELQTQSNIISAVSCLDPKHTTVPRTWIERPLVNNKGWLMTTSEIMSKYVESKGFYADRSILHRSVANIRSNCYKLKAEGRLNAVFVDHIGLMIQDHGSATAEIATMTGQLKKLAGELDVPVFMLSQMNVRDVKGVDRPVMGMLKGSSTIEADSDTILFPWRPWAINKEGDPTEAMLFIGKARSFLGNDIPLEFVEDAVCFKEKEVARF